MLVLRYLTAVSASSILALAYVATATAQPLPSSGHSQNEPESSNNQLNLASVDSEFESSSPLRTELINLSQEAVTLPLSQQKQPISVNKAPKSISSVPPKSFSESQNEPESGNDQLNLATAAVDSKFESSSPLRAELLKLSQEAVTLPLSQQKQPISVDKAPKSVASVLPNSSSPPRAKLIGLSQEAVTLPLSETKQPVSVDNAPKSVASVLAQVQNLSLDDQSQASPPEPRVFEIRQLGVKQPPSENREIAQGIAPQESPQESPAQLLQQVEKKPAPEYVNPSANPLLFPTEPNEVEIDISQPITLEQAIELALRNNKNLQSARITLERRTAELREAQAALWPTLDKIFTFSQNNTARANAQVDEQIARNNRVIDEQVQRFEQQFEQTNGRLPTEQEIEQERQRLVDNTVTPAKPEGADVFGQIRLEYNIYTGGRRGADIKRAEREFRRQELEVEVNAQQVRFDATRNYYDLQNADAQVAIAQAAVEDTTQSLRDAQLLERAGLGTRFDVLQAEVDVARANQDLTRRIAQQRTARRQLAETLSLGQQVELTAADEITEAGTWTLSLDESIVQAYKNRAELEQRLIQREIGEQNREIALADVRPEVDVIAEYQYFDDFSDTVSIADGYSAQARLSWRFFDGGRAYARADQANRDIDLAETDFANQRNQIRLRVETSYFELIANQENIGTAQKNVETATERLRLARLRFQAGVGTQTEVINGQRDLTDARGEFLQAIIDYNQALNSLQREVSNLPDNRLFEFQ